MKIHGEHRFKAPREKVWEALLDPEVLSRTVPGSEGLEQTGENEFRGKLKMKVGPVQGVFEGRVELSDLEPPSGYRMTIDGRGALGFMNGTGLLSLSDDDEGTLLAYEVDVQVGGRIASVGQRLVESSAKVITRQALRALEGQIDARVTTPDRSADEVPAAEMPRAPSQAKMAAGFAGGLLGEYFRKSSGRWTLFVGILALAYVLMLVWRS